MLTALLGNLAVKYILGEHMYAAAEIFPIVPVDKQSDNYVVYDKGDFLRDEAAERAPATESEGGNYDIDLTPYYLCRNYAFHKDVDDDNQRQRRQTHRSRQERYAVLHSKDPHEEGEDVHQQLRQGRSLDNAVHRRFREPGSQRGQEVVSQRVQASQGR